MFWAEKNLQDFIYALSEIRKNICRSDIEDIVKLYGHFRCLQVLYSKQKYIY